LLALLNTITAVRRIVWTLGQFKTAPPADVVQSRPTLRPSDVIRLESEKTTALLSPTQRIVRN
jgi:hypothetical protein